MLGIVELMVLLVATVAVTWYSCRATLRHSEPDPLVSSPFELEKALRTAAHKADWQSFGGPSLDLQSLDAGQTLVTFNRDPRDTLADTSGVMHFACPCGNSRMDRPFRTWFDGFTSFQCTHCHAVFPGGQFSDALRDTREEACEMMRAGICS